MNDEKNKEKQIMRDIIMQELEKEKREQEQILNKKPIGRPKIEKIKSPRKEYGSQVVEKITKQSVDYEKDYLVKELENLKKQNELLKSTLQPKQTHNNNNKPKIIFV